MKKFIPVLTYHSLDPGKFRNKLAISPALFENQMLFLKQKGFRAIELAACIAARWKEGLFGRKVVITFDDGYVDNYQHAFPVLKKMGFPAVFFVTPSEIGKEGFMTWDMLKEIAATPGIEIGSHGLFHKPLADISPEEARTSIMESKKILENRLGREIRAFAYPSGSFNIKVAEMVQAAGYIYACAATHIHDRQWEENPFLLRRIKISDSSRSHFAFSLRLSGFYHLFGRP